VDLKIKWTEMIGQIIAFCFAVASTCVQYSPKLHLLISPEYVVNGIIVLFPSNKKLKNLELMFGALTVSQLCGFLIV
jgi:hypothetical protein